MDTREIVWIDSDYGQFKVTKRYSQKIDNRDQEKKYIVTIPELGLTNESCFDTFFNTIDESSPLFELVLIQIDLPGMQVSDQDLLFPDNQSFIDLHHLSTCILSSVCTKFCINSYIGFGVGLGSYLLSLHAMKNPTKVEGMILISPSWIQTSWKSSLNYWMNKIQHVFTKDDSLIINYLIQRYFSWNSIASNADLVSYYKRFLLTRNQKNLLSYANAFNSRDDICTDNKIKCPLLLICGEDNQEDIDQVTKIRSILTDPTNSDWIRIDDSGILITEEKPHDLVQPISLMLNGMGHFSEKQIN